MTVNVSADPQINFL